jgi:hypothetical protein
MRIKQLLHGFQNNAMSFGMIEYNILDALALITLNIGLVNG